MEAFVRGIQDFGMLVVRLALGLIVITQGLRRWQVNGVAAQAAKLDAYRLPAPDLLAWAGTTFEIVGGVLIVFGLATPLAGFGVLSYNSLLVFLKFQAGASSWEHNLALAALGLVCLVFGSKRLGIDHLFQRRADEAMSSVIADADADLTLLTAQTQQTHRQTGR